ncbi:hypothetical protein GCM10011594_10960 [Nakamurella endophytica]|uniref:Membrane transport protein MMPL domain-containing protein n=1 Tax=Nakamurella endophytica TaxID=1748367 RepID=A0A917SRU0_9ACTN|nr:hypothetical protein GCM10011594_10960 [Nakamurella endophytica]
MAGRWFILVAWVALTFAVSAALPSTGPGGGGEIGSLLPRDSPAVATLQRSLAQFAVPVLSETSVVVHDPAGLSLLTRADVALWALAHVQAADDGAVPSGPGHIVAAVPIPVATAQTAVTYLYLSGGTGQLDGVGLAQQYAAHFHNQASVQTFVAGVSPAQVRQSHYLTDYLGYFETATLVLITVVVAAAFRSVVAPLAVLAVAGLGYLVAVRLLGLLAAALGFAMPEQIQPLLAALLIGVVTDYCVLFFFGFRDQLQQGRQAHGAARRSAASDGPIVAVAGMTVAAGTAALLAANFPLFRAFGPAMSLTILVGLAVSLTLVPSLMAILGHRLFLSWDPASWSARPAAGTARQAGRLIRIVADRRGAAVATSIGVGILVLAALPLGALRLDLSFTSGLPADDAVSKGAAVLDAAGIRGITAPTEVLLEGRGIAAQRPALTRLQTTIDAQPGVAAVLGAAQNPLPEDYGIVVSRDGNAARFVVVLDSDPLGARAIADLQQLQGRLQALADGSGVVGATVSVTGETAIAAELAEITRENLWITLLAALAVELVILVIYLRALVAPLALLLCSALGVAATLGLTVLVFQEWFGDSGLTFYAPFATAVLLLALGSDYNVFTVGSIWDEARRHPLSRAIVRAMPATSRAVSTAGMILASTFAMVAIIPIGTFRQVAFTMTAGLLIDTFLIRPVLTPAVLTLLGSAAGWPSRRIRTVRLGRDDLRKEVRGDEQDRDRQDVRTRAADERRPEEARQ